jgi:hypothetical protein
MLMLRNARMGRWQLRTVIGVSLVHPRSQLYPQAVHTPVMWSLEALVLRCRSVGEMPIYEQLRGERINADVPPSEAALPRVGRSGRHRLAPDTTGPVGVCAPPGPGADLVAHQHPDPGIVDQPVGGPQRHGGLLEPRATLARPTHARQRLTHKASSLPTATGADDPAQAASHGSVDPGLVIGPRQGQRTADLPTATSQGEFPWFESGDGTRDLPFRQRDDAAHRHGWKSGQATR